jgi:hypothetical protein
VPTRGDCSGTFSSKPLDNRAPDQPCATDHQRDVTAQSEIHADEASSAPASQSFASARPADALSLICAAMSTRRDSRSLRWVDLGAQFASTAVRSMGDTPYSKGGP